MRPLLGGDRSYHRAGHELSGLLHVGRNEYMYGMWLAPIQAITQSKLVDHAVLPIIHLSSGKKS